MSTKRTITSQFKSLNIQKRSGHMLLGMYKNQSYDRSLYFSNIDMQRCFFSSFEHNHLGGVMVKQSVRQFDPPSGTPQDYKIDISCFSAKDVVSRSTSKGQLGHESEYSDMSTCALSCQNACSMKIKQSSLVQYKADFIFIYSKITCSCYNMAEKLHICR